MSKIKAIKAREVLDSRGNPTIEADVILEDGSLGSAMVPSGASTGKKEAVELRDNDLKRYFGKGVLGAINSVKILAKELIGLDARDYFQIDQLLIDIDGTNDKSKFGANAILAISLATAKAAAIYNKVPLFAMLGEAKKYNMPVPMMNIINGGAHADNKIDIQEFMIAPISSSSIAEAIRMGSEVFHSLKSILSEKSLSTNVGDEGGFAPNLKSSKQALDFIMQAIEKAGYKVGEDVVLAIDVAASELFQNGKYNFNKANKIYETDELIEFYVDLVSRYPIFSIEDPFDEEDFSSWQKITKVLGNKIQLVGDDVFVTNPKIFQKGIDKKIANAILIKPNQIGSLKETLSAICIAQKNDYNTVMSHRSGETGDTTIAHLAVAYDCKQIKTGSLSRTDRVAKYNELMRIEEYIGGDAKYFGKGILKV